MKSLVRSPARSIAAAFSLVLALAADRPAFAEPPLLSGDGKRIAVRSSIGDAGGGITETSICPAFDGAPCDVFSSGGMGEGWDAAQAARTEAKLKHRLDEGRFKPMVEVPLQSIREEETDFAPIRVKQRHVRVTSGEWTIDVRGKRRFAISLRSASRKARGTLSCKGGQGAVTGAVLVQDGDQVALWAALVCGDGQSTGDSWERVPLEFSRAWSKAPRLPP